MPKDASFSMHSLLVTHYLSGAWYPKGGATEIAYHMIPIIEKAGGAVLVRAPVNRILFNEAREACGGRDFLVFFWGGGFRWCGCFTVTVSRRERHERAGGGPHPGPHGHL